MKKVIFCALLFTFCCPAFLQAANWQSAFLERSEYEGSGRRCYYKTTVYDHRFSFLHSEYTCPVRVYYHVPTGKYMRDIDYEDAIRKMGIGTQLPDPK